MSTEKSSRDYAAITVCTLAWGTTWYAITLQLGVVDPVISVAYRASLAALVLFLWCLVRGEPCRLNRAQHLAAFGVGAFSVAVNYPFAYWAEERIVSGVVAVFYAGVAFFNLIVFRVALGQRAPKIAWLASALGIAGVATLSLSELMGTSMNARTAAGLALALGGAAGAAISNLFARRAEEARTPVVTMLAWAMLYGAALLAAFAVATARVWAFETTLEYVGSLLYLAVISVVAFLLYFGLARRRGYTVAAYILAVTPVIAMTLSGLFEGKKWTLSGVAGAALVLFGQWLLLRKQAHAAAIKRQQQLIRDAEHSSAQ